MGSITIGDEDLDEDYDFMDEDEQTGNRRRGDGTQRGVPQYKYKEILQKLSDRILDEIVIDLDDLVAVSRPLLFFLSFCSTACSGRIKTDESSSW
jgi:DNA replication licensing factor MCM7